MSKKEEILKLYNSGNSRKLMKHSLQKRNPELIKYIEKVEGNSWSEKIYKIVNNNYNDKCLECGNKTKFKSLYDGYRDFCTVICSNNNKEIKDKRENTLLEKYGVKSMLSHPKVREKINETNKIEKKKKKIRDTFNKNMERNNIERNKRVQEYIDKHGHYWNQTEEAINKKHETLLDNYGTINYNRLPEIKQKTIKTHLNKYGAKNYTQTDEYKQKVKDTNFKKKLKIIKNYLEKDNLIFVKYNVKENSINYLCNMCNKNHNILFQTLYIRSKQNRTICIECNPLYDNFNSYTEKEIVNFIKENYMGKVYENNRKKLNGTELDIFLPDLNLAIEFNGLYWHSEMFKDKYFHLNKTSLCEENNIQLIHIFEDDWKYKQDIIKSILLNKLGKSKRIYGRKCIIKEVNSKDKSVFLEENHLQGDTISKVNLGLYYNDELVSLMTFGQRPMNKETELIRFCNKLNTTVIGGANKLFKYYINNYEYDSIISYADRSISQGKLYEKLGFKYLSTTNPNYHYIVGGIKENRFKYRKSELIKKGWLNDDETEHECMMGMGYYRIYNSGNLKFIYK